MIYELCKKAYHLDAKKKKYLLKNFKKIREILNNEDVLYPEENRSGLFEETTIASLKKEARGTHDPETSEDMLKLLESLEKHVGIDNDISYDNISIFLNPLLKGSKKITLRPCKSVGLVNKIHNLSRSFHKNKGRKREQNKIRKDFLENLKTIKTRLSTPATNSPSSRKVVLRKVKFEKKPFDKKAQNWYDNGTVAKNKRRLMEQFGWSEEEADAFIASDNLIK
jgi:hypothetical protein